MIAQVKTADGIALVDLDDETLVALDPDAVFEAPAAAPVSLPLVLAAVAA